MSGDSIAILSAGAPKTGVRKCAEQWSSANGRRFDIEFATAPVIRERVSSGAAGADIVVAPVPAMKTFADDGRIEADTVTELGSVTMGVVVRNGAPEPDISTLDAMIQSLLDAETVVYNEASSGQYVAQMIDRLDLGDKLADKTVRVPSGSAVMEWLAAHPDRDAVGFGQITEIRLHDDLGTHLVGPLPPEVSKSTTYAAALSSSARQPEPGRSLVAFMGSPEGRRIFTETGVV